MSVHFLWALISCDSCDSCESHSFCPIFLTIINCSTLLQLLALLPPNWRNEIKLKDFSSNKCYILFVKSFSTQKTNHRNEWPIPRVTEAIDKWWVTDSECWSTLPLRSLFSPSLALISHARQLCSGVRDQRSGGEHIPRALSGNAREQENRREVSKSSLDGITPNDKCETWKTWTVLRLYLRNTFSPTHLYFFRRE